MCRFMRGINCRNESLKKFKSDIQELVIEMDSLDYPSMKMINKFAEIYRMMADYEIAELS